MSRRRRLASAVVLGAALGAVPRALEAQAFTHPQGLGSVTLAWQYVDNTGHFLSDGFFRPTGPSRTMSALVDVEYGVTDRFAASVSVPYVFAKYTGELPPLSGQPVDACRCWQSALQDFTLGARYRFGGERWAVTPLVRLSIPSHDYDYRGEAVVGRQLSEAHVGVSAGARLPGFLSDAGVHATYSYASVEKARGRGGLDAVSVDRSNLAVDLGYAPSRRLYVRASSAWLLTHGGLRIGSVTGNPFPLPGELNTPERRAAADRLRRVRWGQVGGGASYSVGPVDVFASFTKYVWGRDAHNGQAYNLGATWYFDLSRPPSS